MKIKKDFIDKFENDNILIKFFHDTLNRIPCNSNFTSINGETLNFRQGWCKNIDYFKNKIEQYFLRDKRLNDPEEKQLEIELFNDRREQMMNNLQSSLDFFIAEGPFKDINGYYRLHIPYFKNNNGNSFSFFFEDKTPTDFNLIRIKDGYFFNLHSIDKSVSRKGISVDNKPYFNPLTQRCFVEVDLIGDDSTQISVSRLNVRMYDGGVISKEIDEKVIELISKNKDIFSDSFYNLFNHHVANFLDINNQKLYGSDEIINDDFIKDSTQIKK